MKAALLLCIFSQSAVVVGVEDYQYPLVPTDYSIDDAQRVAEVLKRHKYDVTLLLDPTRQQVVDATQDTDLFYFSGHGFHLVEDDQTTEYLACKDGSTLDSSTLIPVESIKAKLLVLDVCRNRVGDGEGVCPKYDKRILWACSFGEVAREPDQFEGGVFTNFWLHHKRNWILTSAHVRAWSRAARRPQTPERIGF